MQKRQEAPLPQRAQRVRRALLVYFMTFLGREWPINFELERNAPCAPEAFAQ